MRHEIGGIVSGSVISMVVLGITGSVIIWLATAIGSGILSYTGRAIAEQLHRFLNKKKQNRRKK